MGVGLGTMLADTLDANTAAYLVMMMGSLKVELSDKTLAALKAVAMAYSMGNSQAVGLVDH